MPNASGGSVLKDSFNAETNFEDALHPTLFCICLPSIVNKFPLPSAKHKKKKKPFDFFFSFVSAFEAILAESEGFEPPVRRNAYTTFRVWLFRPLRQLSSSESACYDIIAPQ